MTYPPDDREFVPPEWMQLPNDVQLPSSLRMHNLIEKTALFISKHGSQMEILVKAKQAKNPQFDFLAFDSPLNKYYKYLVTSMKSGDYVSSLERPADSGGSDDDDDEDHYLHPSLLGSAAKVNKSPEQLFLPQLPRVHDENSSYSQLVKSLKDKIIREPEKKLDDEQSTQTGGKNDNGNCSSNNNNKLINRENYQLTGSESSNSKSDSISILPSPPSEIQLYIDKLAEYVARKGEDFEKTIRKRNEARFEFLNPGNIYHCHYIKRKLHFLDEKRQAQAEDIMSKSAESNKGPVSFSLPARETKKTVIVNDDASPDQLDKRKDIDLEEQIYSESNQNSVSKEKQEERRRKAALFLSLLKKKSEANEIGTTTTKEEEKMENNNKTKNGTNNNNSEHQNADSPSRSSNISLSPTIEAVTSPASLSKNPSDESSSDSEYSSSKNRANSDSSKPSSSSLLPFKSSDKCKQDKSSSSSPSSSSCSKHSSHHKPHHHHHHHHHPHPHRHHHHRHHGHHHPPHPPSPPHHRHHHGHHKHHRHHRIHHHHHHGRRRRLHSRSRSHSRSSSSRSRSRSPSRSPSRKSRRRRYS